MSATSFLVILGLASRCASTRRAAMPATWGAAAEVPKKWLENPPEPVTDTPSEATTSGLRRVSTVG